MSHLIEVYAKDLGVKIGRPHIQEHFYPIPYNNYITVHNDNKVPSKSYKYWEDVFDIFQKQVGNKYKFIQVGAPGEQRLNKVDDHLPTQSFQQLFYILKRCSAHVGIDSVPVHVASVYDKPIVALYSHTYPNSCRPIWNKNGKVEIIESSRDGNLPSFILDENPHYMDRIYPDQVVQGLFNVLNIDQKVCQKTFYIGPKYGIQMFDVVPTDLPQGISGNINVRMDMDFNESVLAACLNQVVCEITTNRPFNLELLNHRNVKFINYITDSFDEDFLTNLKRSSKPHSLLCTNKNRIGDQRAKYFDFQINEYYEKDIIANSKKALNLPQNFSVASRKSYVLGGKRFVTKYDLNNRQNTDDLWIDMDWLRAYVPQ